MGFKSKQAQTDASFVATDAGGGAVAVDWSKGDNCTVTSGAATVTATHTSMKVGKIYVLELTGSAGGQAFVNSPVASKGTGTALTPSAGAGDKTIYTFQCTGANPITLTLLSKG